MTDAGMPRRRFVLSAAAGAGLCLAAPRPVRAAALGSLLVAGPEGGVLDGWAAVIAPALGRGLPPGAPLSWTTAGSADGVTGANQFEALANPDGSTALLAPGAAVLAWLVGDARTHFDPSQWVSALATVSAGLLASRVPLARMRPGQRLRMAASSPAGPDLPAILALELLGLEVVPVFGVADASGAVDAVVSHAADAAFLRGRGIADQAQSFAAAGAPPVLAMGQPGDPAPARDPRFPDVPTVAELAAVARPALLPAWRATAAAAQLDSALVLPQQTPAAMVAAWRRAAGQAAGAREPSALADQLGLRLLPPAAAHAGVYAAIADQPTLLQLRRWLAERWNWRPA